MDYELRVFKDFSENTLELIQNLDSKIFESAYPIEKMRLKTKDKLNSLILVYFYKNEPIAFKAGFEENQNFHSWLGGVLPNHRGKALASKLMDYQHQWAKDNGFNFIRTHTNEKFSQMLQLNLKNGFKIIDKFVRDNGEESIILEKELC